MTSIAASLGRAAEARVGEELDGAGWLVRTSPDLDYANKIDVQTICPGRRPFDLQVSVGQKSKRQLNSLEVRGVHPISLAELDRSSVTAAEFICEQLCTRVFCPFDQSPIDEALASSGVGLGAQETPVSICT